MRIYIAERLLHLRNAEEEVKEVILRIGQPYQKEDDSWACPIQLKVCSMTCQMLTGKILFRL